MLIDVAAERARRGLGQTADEEEEHALHHSIATLNSTHVEPEL